MGWAGLESDGVSGVTWGVRDELRVGGGLGIRAAGGM